MKRKPKTRQEVYEAWNKSSQWEHKCRWFIVAVGRKCQRCDSTEDLKVRRLHTKNLGREKLGDDVCVVCPYCWTKMREERQKR